MWNFYIKKTDYGTANPDIIGDEVMYFAELGLNGLNADDYMFLCEAYCMHDAKEQYLEELSELLFDKEAERLHP